MIHFSSLKSGNAVAEQTADAVVLLEHRDAVTRATELLRRREPRRPRSHHRDRATAALLGPHRRHEALFPAAADDLPLDLLDGDGILVDAEHACRLARRRTHEARELREVVGRVQARQRLLPLVAVGEIVPVGDDVAERTAVVAERNAAVHAARRLLLHRLRRRIELHLVPVADALLDRPVRRVLAPELQESRHLTHCRSPR